MNVADIHALTQKGPVVRWTGGQARFLWVWLESCGVYTAGQGRLQVKICCAAAAHPEINHFRGLTYQPGRGATANLVEYGGTQTCLTSHNEITNPIPLAKAEWPSELQVEI
jgi:hypothetical protein